MLDVEILVQPLTLPPEKSTLPGFPVCVPELWHREPYGACDP